MAKLNGEQVIAYAYLGGFRGNDLVEAAKVAYGESSWNTDAANSCCVGLWQINLKAHGVTAAAMKDPLQNALQAHKVWAAAGGKWCATGKIGQCNPWQAYGGAMYKSKGASAIAMYMKFTTDMKNGMTPQQIAGSGTGVITGGLPSAGDLAGAVGDATGISAVVSGFNRMGHWITNPDNLMRILKVVLGGAVILVGGALVLEKPITSVIPATAIAKKVLKK